MDLRNLPQMRWLESPSQRVGEEFRSLERAARSRRVQACQSCLDPWLGNGVQTVGVLMWMLLLLPKDRWSRSLASAGLRLMVGPGLVPRRELGAVRTGCALLP